VNQARVLVVDDSSTVRQVLSTAISADRRFRVVGTASTGREALRRVDELRPDVMTLDVEMPELDGPTTLRALRKVHPNLPVLMVSSLNRSSVAAALDASGLGAVEFLAKPSGGAPRSRRSCVTASRS
jgi:two-component system chemotaxis response regulator CheB